MSPNWTKTDQIHRALAVLYPNLFDLRNPVPLKVGLHRDIRAAFPDLSYDDVSRLLCWLTSRVPYLAAMLPPGAVRYGLDGPGGPISEQAREGARQRLLRLGV